MGAAAPGSAQHLGQSSSGPPSLPRTACHAMRPPLCLEHPQPTCSTSSAAFAGAAPAPCRPTARSRCRILRLSAASGSSSGSAGALSPRSSFVRGPLGPQQAPERRLGAGGLYATATPTADAAAADGAIHQHHWQRRGRRRLHVCAAGGPSKKLGGAISSPRGSEVLQMSRRTSDRSQIMIRTSPCCTKLLDKIEHDCV